MSGLSRLHVVTSISPGLLSSSKVNCVPQLGQNARVPVADDLKRVGLPLNRRKCRRSVLNHVMNGAPAVRRQIEQWQFDSWKTPPDTSYRMWPQ
jgi:hypothetical protein